MDDERLRNYTGSHHAAALFALGEAAAVAALVATFGEQLEELRPHPASSQITYNKIARGPITATGVVGATAQEILDELERDGATDVAVDVSLVDGKDETVAEQRFTRRIERER